MFIGARIACRIVQMGMRAILPILPYRDPEILHTADEIAIVCNRQGIKRILLVTDTNIRSSGLTLPLERALKERNVAVTIFDRVVPNPTITCIERAYQAYILGNCQALIAFGGGSAMDCAKACGIRVVKPHIPLAKLGGILKVHARIPTLFAIPTTAGTGSETTLASVVIDEQTGHKYAINDFCLIPRYAVLDPAMTRNLPPFATATTGMDALTHAVEAYIGRSTTKGTRKDAEQAVKLINLHLLSTYYNGANDLQARAGMLKASHLAGRAFTRSYVGYVHAVAHSLGGAYGIPHGLANAVLLPYLLDLYGDRIDQKLARLAWKAGICAPGDSTRRAAGTFRHWVKEMNRSMHIPTHLEGIRNQDISRLARYADKEANPLYPVPVLMDRRQLETIYRQVSSKEERHDSAAD